jgi:hypothetical protein
MEHGAGLQEAHNNSASLLSSWRWWLPPAAISLIFILLFVDPFIGDWDALDYTINSIHGLPSSMALGRSLFIFSNHWLYAGAHGIFGLAPQHAYLLFKYAVVGQGVLAVIACWVLAHDLTHSRQAATIAACLVAFSPVFSLYGGQVMTDVPGVLLVAVALIIHLRGLQQRRVWLVMLGAALLGAGVNLRETLAFFGPWLVLAPFVCGWRPSRRTVLLIGLSCLIFLFCAGAWFAYWFLGDPGYRAAWYGWRESMQAEAALHRITLSTLWPWFAFFLVTAPLVLITLPLAALSEWRRHKVSPMLLLAAVGLFANLLLLMSYATAIGWRYLLTGLPALVPLTGSYLNETLTKRLGTARRALVVAIALIALPAIITAVYLRPLRSNQVNLRTASKEYDRVLTRLPRNAVIISGMQTVAVTYWRGVGAGDWEVIGTGGGWPGNKLVSTIENYLKQGRSVFVDTDPRWWGICSWQREEIPEIVKLQSRFHFRHAFDTIYELRPSEDATAGDAPHLESLLPENRPEDAHRCPPTHR